MDYHGLYLELQSLNPNDDDDNDDDQPSSGYPSSPTINAPSPLPNSPPPEANDPPVEPSRPKRQRRIPSHLQDYQL
ncbi:hypothetical protein DAPPUDRAFT_325307 [Daphnia pulex]|uniref:Uncharacterized protein n=1 Tax=Daphnia pulex TaxID=6669 RepID=E9H4C3_DAPPU|nr:hypothetical protein DAPPUDRAFT_325307 [Daphnia pulex]|eukprot:EFX73356.1 hypothetical protein DAPPUDRAFT_325307 [Daphnia pulex]